MIFAFFGWLVLTAAITFGAYRLTQGNKYYTVVFGMMSFFAPPLGLSAFILFAVLSTLKPAVTEPESVPLSEKPPKAGHTPIEKNTHYSERLQQAETKMKKYADIAKQIETKIEALHADIENPEAVLAELEEEKAKNAVKKIAAEEEYDRLKKLRH